MTIPGFHRIDPQDLANDLARQRLDPPQREWAVRHPDGQTTVRIDGHAFMNRRSAEDERATCDRDCEWCDGGTHALVYRDRQPWQTAP